MFKNIFKNFAKKPARLGKLNRGVSLIELLVVIAIFMIISSITLFSYNDFRSSLSIQNLSDDIALSVRKAQNFATGSVGASGIFSYGYGLNFSIKPVGVSNNSSIKSFIIFIDRNGSGDYDSGDGSCGEETTECIEMLSITSNDYISEITFYKDGIYKPIDENQEMNLLFRRPNPEPSFCYQGDCNKKDNISNIKIRISSQRDATIYKIITISNNGQISVDF